MQSTVNLNLAAKYNLLDMHFFISTYRDPHKTVMKLFTIQSYTVKKYFKI